MLLRWVKKQVRENKEISLEEVLHKVDSLCDRYECREKDREEAKHEVEKGFEMCDANGDKKVDAEELKKCMEEAGV